MEGEDRVCRGGIWPCFTLKWTSVLLLGLSMFLMFCMFKVGHVHMPYYVYVCGIGTVAFGILTGTCGVLLQNAEDESELLPLVIAPDTGDH